MVKDLIVTVDQEDAKTGVFLTLEPATKGMVTQAAAGFYTTAGFYKTEYGQFPKIQIVTVEELFGPGQSAAFALARHIGVQEGQAREHRNPNKTGSLI
jgi:hypothetical protein